MLQYHSLGLSLSLSHRGHFDIIFCSCYACLAPREAVALFLGLAANLTVGTCCNRQFESATANGGLSGQSAVFWVKGNWYPY